MSDRGLIIYVRSSSRRSCSIVMHPSRGTMIIREGCTRIRERHTHHPLTSHMIILVGRPLATRAGVHDRSARTQEVAYIGTHSAPQDPTAQTVTHETHRDLHTNTSTQIQARATDHAAARARSLPALCCFSLHPCASYGAGDNVNWQPPPSSSSS